MSECYRVSKEKIKTGYFSYSGTNTIEITLGWRPKQVFVQRNTDSGALVSIYDADISTTKYARCVPGSGSGSGITMSNISASATYGFTEITDTGFSVRGYSNVTYNMKYTAIRDTGT